MHPIERLRWIARAEDEPAASLASEAAWTLGELARQEPTALLTACRRLLDRHPACGPLWWVSCRLMAADDAVDVAHRAAAELCSDSTPDRIAAALRQSFTATDVVALTVPLELSAQALLTSKPYPLRVVASPWSIRRSMRQLAGLGASEITGWTSGEELEALDGASVLLVEALAAGRRGVLAEPMAAAAVEAARAANVPVWATVGVGRALPDRLFDSIVELVDRGTADGEDAHAAGDVEPTGAIVDALAVLVPLDVFDLAIGPELTADPPTVIADVTCPPGLELLRRHG
ncbi:MAG: hypothetical protein ABSD78_12775 [Acidimicrobiales bacterium]|jgi:hypothetical protein